MGRSLLPPDSSHNDVGGEVDDEGDQEQEDPNGEERLIVIRSHRRFTELGRYRRGQCSYRIEHARTFEYPGMTVAEMKVELLENFAGHLRDDDPLRCTPRDAVQALAVVEACYKSAASRGAVQVPEAL